MPKKSHSFESAHASVEVAVQKVVMWARAAGGAPSSSASATQPSRSLTVGRALLMLQGLARSRGYSKGVR